MIVLDRQAPMGEAIVDYDRHHLALYASLLEAEDTGLPWQNAASVLMHLDVTDCDAEICWRSHIERARWIVGDGLGSALVAFNSRKRVAKAE